MAAPPAIRWQPTPVEPSSFWVAWRPARWPYPATPWSDVSLATLGVTATSRDPELAAQEGEELPSLVYCPPVAPAAEEQRFRWAEERLAAGTRVLYQCPTGETPPAVPAAADVLWDPLPELLAGEDIHWPEVSAGLAVWPLVAGLSADPERWLPELGRLRRAGFETVQGLVLELDPGQRRVVAEALGEGAFDAVFHGAVGDERSFARAAAEHSLQPFWPRPIAGSGRELGNRRIAAALAQVGDLWLRLDRQTIQGQAFFRAARWAEEATYDLTALIREGNLAVLTPLDEVSRRVAAETVLPTAGGLLEELLSTYLETSVTASAPAVSAPEEEIR
ncbi:MAG: hypothetical protein AAF604_23905 [Acidobacteriota bacterium]